MQVRLLFFASLKDIVGARQLRLDLPEGATVEDVLVRLESSYPKMKDYRPVVLTALNEEYVDKRTTIQEGDELVSSGYMRRVPDDPFTMSNTSWQVIPSEPDPTNPTAAPGVYDVKSGSDAVALDGSKYADWD